MLEFNENTILFVMPIMINVPSTRLRFNFPRTIFPIELRLQQVLNGIQSLKQKMKNHDIRLILLESSQLPDEYIQTLKKEVDIFMDACKHPCVYECSTSDCKSRGENCIMNIFLKWFAQNYPNKKYKMMIKYGCRYSLNEHFNIENWLNQDKFTFVLKKPLPWCTENITKYYVHTVMYSIPFSRLNLMIRQTNKCHYLLQHDIVFDIENVIASGLNEEECDISHDTIGCDALTIDNEIYKI